MANRSARVAAPIVSHLRHIVDEPLPQRRVIYRGRKIDLALQPVRLSDGSLADREVVVHRGAVALVPMVDRDHVCLIRNFRYAVGRTLLEVPAGTLDHGESPDETAGRELAEETGYRAGSIRRVAEWFVSPGVMSERMFLYLCEDLQPGPTDHQLDERLETVVLEWSEAMKLVHEGEIEDAKTQLALLLCDRMRG
jgi:ADP-ribose pyrophosphatase